MEILLVDDEKDTGRLVKKLLERHGYRVRVVTSGDEAIELLESGYEPSLILMDIFMPEMSGIDATRKIKSNPSTTRIPLLLFTVMGGISGIRHLVKESGANGFIPKPFDKEVLLRKIEKMLGQTTFA